MAGLFKAWSRRWVQNPIVSGLLLSGLGFSVSSLHGSYGSRLGAWMRGLYLAQPIYYPGGMRVYAVREQDGFRIIDENSESADEVSRLITQRPRDLFIVAFDQHTFAHGLYAPTAETTEIVVRARSLGSPAVAAAEHVGARRAFVDWLRDRDLKTGDKLLRGDSVTTRPLWSGYIHNAAAVLGLLLLLYSMAWIPRARGWLAATRRQRALSRGRCPSCGYSIRGLPEPVCPECGKPWNVTAEDPPVASPGP